MVLDDDVAATVENFDAIEMSVFIFTSFFLLFLYTYTLIAKIIASAQDIDERFVRHRQIYTLAMIELTIHGYFCCCTGRGTTRGHMTFAEYKT